MSDDIVVLRTYTNELEAQLDAAVLEAHGVPARVSGDTAGGAYPGMALIMPTRLLVRAEDAALAAEILDAPAGTPEDDEAFDEPPA
ncbi:putative signal transducing protein [Longimicrobium sp.]|uniref:putative signal transducing protein n=1 Tax=Longimicrobium sp. TaxID=2029185 RepID=UPI002E311B70|nr:DUF2007 domain-containing protein [Longimicrobium sp.]HEX6037168.1 DUF2007 domain-containing protein [Longimicrobium sp.]